MKNLPGQWFYPWLGRGLIAAIFILALASGIYFRLYPVTYNAQAKLTLQARLIALTAIKRNISEIVDRDFSDLNIFKKEALKEERLKNVLEADKDKVNALIGDIVRQRSALKPIYLLEADSYYYLGLTGRLLEQGSLGLRQANKYFNSLELAPLGYWNSFDLHPYVGLYYYRFLKFFSSRLSLEFAAASLPILLFIISLGIFFWLFKVLKFKKIPFFFGALCFALMPIFILRSSFGWYDTDLYNVIFPALVIIFSLQSLNPDIGAKKRFFYLVGSAISSGAYSVFWNGWVYLPAVVIFSYIISAVIFFLRPDKKMARFLAKAGLVYIGVLAITLLSCIGFSGVKAAIGDVIRIIIAFAGFKKDVWPDFYLTIGELRRPGFLAAINYLGGIFIVIIAAAGFIRTAFFCRIESPKNAINLFILSISVLLLFFSLEANRFMLFAVIPVCIFFARGISFIFDYLRRKIPSGKQANIVSCLTVTVFALLMFTELNLAHAYSTGQVAIMNNVWARALEQIRVGTPKNSIINSWWPPGHFITALAQRRVTLDGATQIYRRSYWVAKAFLCNDEAKSAGIFRMLNSSGAQAYNFLVRSGFGQVKAVEILDSLFSLNKEEALLKLSAIMPLGKAQAVVNLTHGQPDPAYVFIYNDLIDSIIILPYIGNWDFKKKEEFNKNSQGLKLAKRGSQEYKDFIWAMSGAEPYVEAESFEVSRDTNNIYFSNGLILSLGDMSCKINRGKLLVPKSILYLDGETLKEKIFENSNFPVSVLLVNVKDKYSVVVADNRLLKSLIFRLYYLGGKGLKFFTKTLEEDDALEETRVMLYKINWEKLLKENKDVKEG